MGKSSCNSLDSIYRSKEYKMPSQEGGQGPIFLSATDYALPKAIPEGTEKYTN